MHVASILCQYNIDSTLFPIYTFNIGEMLQTIYFWSKTTLFLIGCSSAHNF
jgi:hypothetical protein